MKVRRLTNTGVGDFSAWIGRLCEAQMLDPPLRLLADDATSEPFQPEIDVAQRIFANRFDAAKYLAEKLAVPGVVNPERDVGLWAWLTLFYFDQLCPKRADGTRKPGELARYIVATGSFQRIYRHLLLGPFLVYRAHDSDPSAAMAVLQSPLHQPGEIVEQLASRQEFIANSDIMRCATWLYFDAARGALKRGSGGKGPGSPRRFASTLNQYDLTYDLAALDHQGLMDMLPSEFDRFRSQPPV
jgi:hypothetical protein